MIINSLQEFCKFFYHNQPIIAIDYGIKKLGIAISSPDHKIAMPFKMITATNKKEQIATVLSLLKEKQICGIIVGLPVNIDGSHSEQTEITLKFARQLAGQTNIPIFMQDERLTTKAADSLLKNFGFNRKKRNSQDDVIAASLILETVLESIKRL
ncbi:MAG: Holliday junction resolvase RuvX [Rickettsiaceae bacterium]|nr:Holliday junction resolvase RuvX [Rickettsiaceae bacterium]